MSKSYHIEFDIDFKRNPHKGVYVALEGIDGAGKTVQMERLLQYFQKQEKDVVATHEPRRTGLIGRVINEFLQGRVDVPSVALQYLMSADRIFEQHEQILPSLKKGEMVITHRCFWSSIPYGILDYSEGKEIDFENGNILMVAQSILSMYYQIVVPDITFYIDISAETALERLTKAGNTLEYYEKLEKLEAVREGYLWMAKRFPDEIIVIEGDRDPKEITKELIKKIESFKK